MSLLEPQEVAQAQALIKRLADGLSQVVLDQPRAIECVTAAVVARGHVLLEGLPGLGKTELCKGLSALLSIPFKRIQFTPDLLPSDITGTYVMEGPERAFVFRPGPLFASLVLADEINRASPKTQAALLEAMQERSVTSLGQTHPLPDPFFVVATQNPIELEGTYPLPEAQLDRFMFRVLVPRVKASTLSAILTQRVRGAPPELKPVVQRDELKTLFALADRVHLPQAVADYVARLVEASDPESASAPEAVRRYVRFGASPRAAIAIAASARAVALTRGRPNVGFDDVQAVFAPALNHRLVLAHEALIDKLTATEIIAALKAAIPEAPRA